MSQPSKYLDYLHCDFGGLYFATERCNWFSLSIEDNRTGTYHVKPIKTKSQIFDTF